MFTFLRGHSVFAKSKPCPSDGFLNFKPQSALNEAPIVEADHLSQTFKETKVSRNV